MWANILWTQTQSLTDGSQGLVNGKAHKDVIVTLPLLSWLLGAVLSASRCHTDVLCAMRMPCEPLLEDLQEPRSTKTKRASNILGLFSNEVCSTRCTSNNLQQKKRWWLTSTFPSFRRTLVSPSTQVSWLPLPVRFLYNAYTYTFWRNTFQAGHDRISSWRSSQKHALGNELAKSYKQLLAG